MNSQFVLTVMGAVLTVAGAMGIAYAVFRSATVQKTLELYKSENEALGKAVARLQSDYVTIAARAEELERANRVLQETVTGKSQLEELAAAARLQEERRFREHQVMTEILKEINEQMAEMWRGVARLLGER